MSYSIRLCDPKTDEGLNAEESHDIRGGTFALGDTTELWLNVTYNYSGHFRRVLGNDGIRSIYGMTGEESIPVLEGAITKLGDNMDDDYWKPTEGNARKALKNLVKLARMALHGVWDGD